MSAHPITPERIAALLAIRDATPGNGINTQSERLLEAIRKLGHITTFEASRYLDIYHPPARKLNLVKAGHKVLTSMRDVLTEAGKRHRVGVYFLERVCMTTAKKTAPGVSGTQGASKTMHSDFASQQDFTPEAAASAWQIGFQAIIKAQVCMARCDFVAALCALRECHKAIGAAIDSLAAYLGKGGA